MADTVTAEDTQIIRGLARRAAEIAGDPVNAEKRDMWTRLNRLERVRPLIHIQALARNIWEELIPGETLATSDPFARRQELELRKRIYCWENFCDDRVVPDSIICPIAIQDDLKAASFGLEKDLTMPEASSGAHAFRPVIVEDADIDIIQTESEVWVDWEETERRYQQLCELYDGILPVQKRGQNFFWFAPMDTFSQWRGIEQMFLDLVDKPEWLHAALERITAGFVSNIERLEQLNALTPGHGNAMLGSGGWGWTDQLPQSDFDGEHVRLKDLWARASTQIFAEVSPAMHDEFAVHYEKQLLEKFGLSCYGCCEPLHNKVDIARKIGNLRRISMSPWVDIARASEAVGTDYVYTHKPNPSIVSTPGWDLDLARDQLRDAFEKTRENIMEVNLQDLHTVQNEPHRLTEWAEMAMQLAEEYA
jgi:hypothetical protein